MRDVVVADPVVADPVNATGVERGGHLSAADPWDNPAAAVVVLGETFAPAGRTESTPVYSRPGLTIAAGPAGW